MTDERWQSAWAIYEAAASLAASERKQYVEAAAPDAELASRVLEMLEEIETTADEDADPEAEHSTDGSGAAASGSLPDNATIGRFLITGFVGQGGMGKVYSARDPDLNRDVALKVIATKAAASSSETIIREAHAASALNHPNIATVYEVIRSGPTVAIVMELVTGTPLRELCGTAHPVHDVAIRIASVTNVTAP